jgi:hypothetical protein
MRRRAGSFAISQSCTNSPITERSRNIFTENSFSSCTKVDSRTEVVAGAAAAARGSEAKRPTFIQKKISLTKKIKKTPAKPLILA